MITLLNYSNVKQNLHDSDNTLYNYMLLVHTHTHTYYIRNTNSMMFTISPSYPELYAT